MKTTEIISFKMSYFYVYFIIFQISSYSYMFFKYTSMNQNVFEWETYSHKNIDLIKPYKYYIFIYDFIFSYKQF